MIEKNQQTSLSKIRSIFVQLAIFKSIDIPPEIRCHTYYREIPLVYIVHKVIILLYIKLTACVNKTSKI